MADTKLRILVIGAHPDDCDIKAGGVAALYRQDGHEVRFVSLTNGESGHHRLSGEKLATIRRQEAAAAGKVIGIQYDVLNNQDGYLLPSLPARLEIIALIRRCRPDLILTHRPNDYHPDHRYTSQLVCDAAYMVTVPPVVPEVPALREDPVIAYFSDGFTRPYPFSPTVVVDIEPVIEWVVDMLDCYKSQFYEWLPYNRRQEEVVPADTAARRRWLGEQFRAQIKPLAEKYREQLIHIYGEQQGRPIRYIEAFEPCEYGSPLTEQKRRQLFPFLP